MRRPIPVDGLIGTAGTGLANAMLHPCGGWTATPPARPPGGVPGRSGGSNKFSMWSCLAELGVRLPGFPARVSQALAADSADHAPPSSRRSRWTRFAELRVDQFGRALTPPPRSLPRRARAGSRPGWPRGRRCAAACRAAGPAPSPGARPSSSGSNGASAREDGCPTFPCGGRARPPDPAPRSACASRTRSSASRPPRRRTPSPAACSESMRRAAAGAARP